MIINIIFALLITICYLIGGQLEKSVRRYGVPVFAGMFAIIKDEDKKFREKLRYFMLLAIIGVLSMGYGENSWLKKAFPWEWMVRFAYAFILAIVFAIAGSSFLMCFPVLVIAFQIRAGKLFSIGKFDFLIEDIFRALAIFTCTLITIRTTGGIIW